jgi:hypothetical protein
LRQIREEGRREYEVERLKGAHNPVIRRVSPSALGRGPRAAT